jgi:hypothetical protein
MAIVTESYILIRDISDITYPATATNAINQSLESGVIVSNTKTLITDPLQVVPGKEKFNVVRVFRSAEDRQNFIDAGNANAELQSYWTSTNTEKINRIIS